jgi:hypothetical protein
VTDPGETDASLLHAVRPDGVLAIIDFPPMFSWLWPWPPKGVPENRGGHGVAAQLVVNEVSASGFELLQVINDWPGRWPLPSYCAVFRKPPKGPAAHAGARTPWGFTVQSLWQRSVSTVLPSSHASPGSLMPFPQTGWGQKIDVCT